MPQIELHAVCYRKYEQGERHDFTPEAEKLAKKSVDIDSIEEQPVRSLLERHITQFTEATGCTEATGYAKLREDVPEKQIRAGVDLVDTRQNGYMPGAITCDNCKWLAVSGTSFRDEDGNWLFFCSEEACKAAANAISNQIADKALEQHVAEGLCLYVDSGYGRPGFCTNTFTTNDHLCDEHRGLKCGLCGKQATNTMWEYGSLAYSHIRCDEHRGLYQLERSSTPRLASNMAEIPALVEAVSRAYRPSLRERIGGAITSLMRSKGKDTPLGVDNPHPETITPRGLRLRNKSRQG